MSEQKTVSFGAWQSPISAEMLVEATIPPGQLQIADDAVYWVEIRPSEAGRYVVIQRTPDGAITDLTPEDHNVRTLVHEYGGGEYWLHDDILFYVNFVDQCIYRLDPGQEPKRITPEPDIKLGMRYADGRLTPDGRLMICVRERHREEGEAFNELVVLPADGSAEPAIIASGRDFYAAPRISPEGTCLAWLEWDHPNMPWDGTEVWTADLAADGALSNQRKVAGGQQESIFQPEWSPDGVLHFISDRSNWWNLYRVITPGDELEHLARKEVEFGQPQWVFGLSRYAFLPGGRIAAVITKDGFDSLVLIDQESVSPCTAPFTSIEHLQVLGDDLWFVGASPTIGANVIRLALDGEYEIMGQVSLVEVGDSYFPQPEAITFPTENGLEAHAFFYPPTNPDFVGPADEQPPLIVFSHGGPTSAVKATRSINIAYWTSRGIGVVDVNYGGSTGWGREYRQRLNGQWGVVDVEDCINAAKYLVARGDVDGSRVAVRGGSAGGYTTLMALTKYDYFNAGASYFGLSELESFVNDTHKFEARYLFSMIGPYPEQKELYKDRSPINFADQISTPMILLQGDEDKVVPPSQAEIMVEVLAEKGLPYAYILFEGEQHGFRKAENITRAAEAELYFYGQVFGFIPSDDIAPVEIHNLPG